MKVLHVIARMNVGGTATYLLNLIQGLEKQGVESLLALGRVPSNEREDKRIASIKLHRIGTLSRAISPISDFKARRELDKLIKEYKPDVIHTHTFKAGLLIRSKKRQVPIIHTFHGHHLYDPDYGRFARLVLNTIERKLAKKSAKILTIGSRVGDELLEAGIGRREQYRSIAPGIAPINKVDREVILEKFLLPKAALNVLWMGRLTRVKRADRVIELAKRFVGVNFIIAGDGELRALLEGQAPSNLYFLGIQSPDELFSIADIVLLTSDSEGMPLTLIEAQMAALPSLASDVGSVSEIIEDGVTGFISPNDIDQLALSLAKLIDDSMLRSTMAKAAAIRAKENFSVEKMVASHIQSYQQVIG